MNNRCFGASLRNIFYLWINNIIYIVSLGIGYILIKNLLDRLPLNDSILSLVVKVIVCESLSLLYVLLLWFHSKRMKNTIALFKNIIKREKK